MIEKYSDKIWIK